MRFLLAKLSLLTVLITVLKIDGVHSVTGYPEFIVWGDTGQVGGEYCLSANDELTAVTLQPCDFDTANPKQLFIVDDEKMFMSAIDSSRCLGFLDVAADTSLDEAPVIMTDCYSGSDIDSITSSFFIMNNTWSNDHTLVQLRNKNDDDEGYGHCLTPLNDVPCSTNNKGAISMLHCQSKKRYSWRFVVAECTDLVELYQFEELSPTVGRICLWDSNMCMEASVSAGTVHLVNQGDVTLSREGTWVWDGNLDDGICFSSGLLVVGTHEGGKYCLQQGHNDAGPVEDGTILIVEPCDCTNVLQQFDCEWFNEGPYGGRLRARSNTELCVHHHGEVINGDDNIILKMCSSLPSGYYASASSWTGVKAQKRIWFLMKSGEIIRSDNAMKHIPHANIDLLQEEDGSFKVLRDSAVLWESTPMYEATPGSTVVMTKLQGDGNLITRDDTTKVLWKSQWFGGTVGTTDVDYYLAISEDMVALDDDYHPVSIGVYPGSPIESESSGVVCGEEYVDMLWKDDVADIP